MTRATRWIRPGYRLRTSGGPLAALCLIGLHLSTLLSALATSRGDLMRMLQVLGSGFLFLCPLVIVLFALPPVLKGGSVAEQTLLPLRPARHRLRRWAVDTAALACCHAAFVLCAFVWTLSHGAELTLSVWVTLTMNFVTIAFMAALGRAIGEVTCHPAGVLAAGAVGVLMVAYASGALRFTAGSSPYAGLRLVYGPYVVAIAVVIGLAAVLATLPRSSLVGTLAICTSLVVLVATGRDLGEPDLVVSGDTPADCARSMSIEICVFPGYSVMLPDLVTQSDRAMAAFRAAGVDPRVQRVEQAVPGNREEPGVASVDFDDISLGQGRLSEDTVSSALFHPGWCPQLSEPTPPGPAFDRWQRLAFTWLAHQSGLLSDERYAQEAPDFSRESTRMQVRAVQAFLDSNHDCRGIN